MEDFLDEYLTNLESESQKLHSIFLTKIQEIISGLPQKNGVISTDQNLTNLLAEIRKSLTDTVFQSSEYTVIKDGISEGFSLIDENLTEIHKSINDIDLTDSFLSEQTPIRNAFKKAALDSIVETNVNAAIINPVIKSFGLSIDLGYSYQEALAELSKQARVDSYFGQVLRDSFFQYDGHVNRKVQEKYDLKFLKYTGSIVQDSRGQCRKWMDMGKIAVENLDEEIRWAKNTANSYKKKKVAGMVPTTSEKNFIVYRGGYNCRHRVFPVRE